MEVVVERPESEDSYDQLSGSASYDDGYSDYSEEEEAKVKGKKKKKGKK